MDRYLSLGIHTILACFTAVKNSPFSKYLLNETVISLMYSLDIVFKRNADVSTLSVDFVDENLLHSLITLFIDIVSNGIFRDQAICSYIELHLLWKALFISGTSSAKCFFIVIGNVSTIVLGCLTFSA
jgi:hypothetical protein